MLRCRIYPTLLYRDRGLVKGVKFTDHRYVGDILNAIHIYNLNKVDELAVLDIGATTEGRSIDPKLVHKVSTECMMPLSVGGGIRTGDQAQALLSSGAEKVILCTHVFDNPKLISEIAGRSGAQSVVVSVDVRKVGGEYRVFANNGTRDKGVDVVTWAKRVEEQGAGEIQLNAIDRDGTGLGYDADLIRLVATSVNVPIIALGGGATLAHVKAAADAGASAVTAGSMFVFYGRRRAVLINFPEQSELEALFDDKATASSTHAS